MATRRRPGRLLARHRRSTALLWLLFLCGTVCYQASFLLPLHPPLVKHEVIAVAVKLLRLLFHSTPPAQWSIWSVLSCAVLRERSPRAPQCEASPTNTATASSSRAFSFSTAYAKYGSLMQLEVAAGDQERGRDGGEAEGWRAGLWRRLGGDMLGSWENEEYDREMGSGGVKG